MAAITIDKYSEQATKQNNQATSYSQLKPNELHGRIRVGWFYYKPTAAVAADAVVALIKLPKGARILGGKVLSNGHVATADLDVGLVAADGSGELTSESSGADDDSDMFADNLDVATAGEYDFANTIALNQGYVLQKECWLVGKFQLAGMDGADDILQGYVKYVVD